MHSIDVHVVTISPKFHIAIPKALRQQLGLRAGQKLQAIVHDDCIELVPVRRMKETRGFLRGIETTIERDDDRV